MRRSTEAAAAGVAGAMIGGLAALPTGFPVVGAVIAGANGAISGWRRIYPWRRPAGRWGFVLDSSWGLVGVTGGLLVHGLQAILKSAHYRSDLSERGGAHIYEGGFAWHPTFTVTTGNVISNAGAKHGVDLTTPQGVRTWEFLRNHEMLHVWQGRWFGPFFPLLYAVWGALAPVVATKRWLRDRTDWWRLVVTAAYYNNPFETWAYRKDGYWPPHGADTRLAWKGRIPDSAN